MSTAERIRLVLGVTALAGALTLAIPATADAQPPIRGTDVSRFSESFSDPFFCGGELYAVTANGHAVMHFAYFADTGAFHFHEVAHGRAVSLPVDGTGPTYTANFWNSDSESIRAVRHGDLLV